MNIIFLGAPGAGKGTQAEVISKRYGLFHVSTGHLFRKALAEKQEIGKIAQSYMDRGALVPDQVVLKIVSENLPKNPGYLFDGFPRNVSQAESLEGMLLERGQSIHAVININVDHDRLLDRLLGRGRSDDNHETITHRLTVYRTETQPLIDYYSKKSLLVDVDGNQAIDTVTQQIEKALELAIGKSNG